MRFSPSFIERVRESNDLVDFIGSVTLLKSRNSTDFQGRCPFPDHNDSSPSFSVSRTKQIYHCFGCGKSGNIFTFLRDHEGLSFMESVEFLARKAGIPLPTDKNNEDNKTYQQQQEKKQQLYKIQNLALVFFQENLLQLSDKHPVHKYIQQRGLLNSTLKDFKIGYAPKGWNQLTEKIKTKGFSIDLACESGLIKKGESGYYDVFRNRLMFPIFSTMGDCIGFGGRSLDKESQPKYINSSNSPIFHKGKHPYHGPSLSLPALRQKNQVILVEGYMDLIQLHQAGTKNVLATLGTALTENHCKSIKKFSKQVLIVFDGDHAGQQATEKSLTILLSNSLCPRILLLPKNQDPDDYLQHLKQEGLSPKKVLEHLEQKINSAPDLFIHLLEEWMHPFKERAMSPIEKTDLVQRLAPLFDSMKDTLLKEMYLKETAFKIGIEKVTQLRQMLQKTKPSFSFGRASMLPSSTRGTPQTSFRNTQNPQRDHQTKNQVKPKYKNESENIFESLQLGTLHPSELYILVFCLHSEKFLRIAMECEVTTKFIHPQLKILFQKIYSKMQQGKEKAPQILSWLSSYVDKPQLLYSPKAFFYENGQLNEAKANKLFIDSIIITQKRFLQKELNEMRIQSRHQDKKNEIQYNKKLKKFQEMKENLDELKKRHMNLNLEL